MDSSSMKRCWRCKQDKLRSAFTKDRGRSDGLNPKCRACTNKDYKHNWYTQNKLAYTKSSLKRLYGISLEQFNILFEEQNGVCAICMGTNPSGKRLAVDHDHETGQVRGLLCSMCNTRLAVLDDKLWIKKAKRYKGFSG